MCLVCLRPTLQHGCWFNSYPVLVDWMHTVYRSLSPNWHTKVRQVLPSLLHTSQDVSSLRLPSNFLRFNRCPLKKENTDATATILLFPIQRATRSGKTQNLHCIVGKRQQPNAAQDKFYTLARFSLLINVDIMISYPNTQTFNS